MFRPNLLRVCNRLHVGIKSTMISSRVGVRVMVHAQPPSPPPPPIVVQSQTTRHFAASSNVPSTSTSTAGGSAFIPSGLLRSWYNTFGRSTSRYATFFILLVVIGEYTFKGISSTLWNMSNNGRTFETTDWSPFDEVDEEEEEEEEEEDDE